MVKNKREAEAAHFKRRLASRYNLIVNHKSIIDLLNLVGTNKCRFIYKCSNTRSVYEISYQNMLIKVLYDKVRKMFITAIPFSDYRFEMLEEKRLGYEPFLLTRKI